MNRKIALVTGASSGIGAAAALQLAAAGFVTYAAARRMSVMAPLREHGIKLLALDITDEASIASCVALIRAESGGVDVLVNNAGYGAYGAIEDVPLEEARRQFEVNVFGLAGLTQALMPHMREQRRGRIINVSSIAGVGAVPYGAWYHATKFALEAYSAALRQELRPFGVQVVVIRPGGTRTEWGGIAMDSLQRTSGQGPYADAVRAVVAAFEKNLDSDRAMAPPEAIADLILKAALAGQPKPVYTGPRLARVFVLTRWLLSDRMFDRLVRRALRLPATMGALPQEE